MYKVIVSCYYWPAGEYPLRLRTLTINVDKSGSRLQRFPISKLTRLEHLTSSIERREMRRLKLKCEVELLADLSLLDTDAGEPLQSLVFMGQTSDLSTAGLAMVLPSMIMDERFCDGDNRLNLTLHLPEGAITLEVAPVRCERITGINSAQGYLLGTKITNIGQRDRLEQYIERMSDPQRAH